MARASLLCYVLLTEKKKKNKNAQSESCELSFIWGKTRTVAQGTASQIALQSCSREVSVEVKPSFWQKFPEKVAAGYEEQMSPLMILVLF